MIRVDRLDKLDRINYYDRMHSRLVKWWNVNMLEGAEEEIKEEEDSFSDYDSAAEALLNEALAGDADTEALTEEAMEIFNRLQAEAAADEAAKQAEIEAAKAAAAAV
ncbi:MAG: hypothetical protein K5987_05630 [Lachnospiraceae bacterium]|nr:hypothetical protein [Lachnospiraceae bacterium]